MDGSTAEQAAVIGRYVRDGSGKLLGPDGRWTYTQSEATNFSSFIEAVEASDRAEGKGLEILFEFANGGEPVVIALTSGG